MTTKTLAVILVLLFLWILFLMMPRITISVAGKQHKKKKGRSPSKNAPELLAGPETFAPDQEKGLL